MLKKTICFFVLLFASAPVFADDLNLSRYEKSIYSSHGEDGVLAKIFQLIKPPTTFCVELGAGEGTSGSATYLLRKQGWNCILLDRSHETPAIHLFKAFITAENVNELLDNYNVPHDLAFLNIDLGYNDFYIWRAISQDYKPAVVVIGYNANIPPSEDWVVKYHPFFCGDGTDYYGAGILALSQLGKAKGYSLVYGDQSGNSLFFIRDEILAEKGLHFKDRDRVEQIYRKDSNAVYRPDPKKRAYVSAEFLLNDAKP